MGGERKEAAHRTTDGSLHISEPERVASPRKEDTMRYVLGLIAAALLALVPAAAAEAPPGPAFGRMARNFDPATVATVSGEVAAVHRFPGRRGEGLHVDLKTADGAVLDVHLGPSSFLAARSLELASGDAIEVTGSRIALGGTPTLIAQAVKKGDATVTLRDASGIPAWSRRACR
jgi:hypothetical protein